MNTCLKLVPVLVATFPCAVPAALAQINLPRELPQLLDTLKGQAEQQKPAPPPQSPPARESPSSEPQPTQSQPAPQAATRAAGGSSQALERNEHYGSFKSWALSTQYPNPVPNMFKFCVQTYDKMIASGIAPGTRVPDEKVPGQRHGDPSINWSGTVQEIKENWCEAGLQKITGDVEKRHAPYRKALKADKLRLVIDETHGHVSSYAMPGGRYTDDPQRLASAPVWFLDLGAPSNERQTCPTGGKRQIVRRYTFDAQHKLLGTTSREYCGSPPASAYQ